MFSIILKVATNYSPTQRYLFGLRNGQTARFYRGRNLTRMSSD